MTRFPFIGFAFLLGTACSDSKGRLTTTCIDDKQEAKLAQEASAANAITKERLGPYQTALKVALDNPPATTSSACELVPPKRDWKSIAYNISLGQPIERGLTLIGPMYLGTSVNVAEAVQPSRIVAANKRFTPRSSLEQALNLNPNCPDYTREIADWAELSKNDFWTYEIVVVDDGDASHSETRLDTSGKAKESRAPSWCVPEAKPSASALPQNSAALDADVPRDDFHTRCGRIFAYDYSKKAVTCFGHFTLPYRALTLQGDQEMEGALLVAGIAAVHAVQ